MTRRHLPSPKSSLRMFARLDERGIDDSMTFTRGPGSWSTQVAEAVDGDTFIEYGTSQNTPRHAYSAALGRRGFHMEPTRTNVLDAGDLGDVAPANGTPDGWLVNAGTPSVVAVGGPTGGAYVVHPEADAASSGYDDTIAPYVGGTSVFSLWLRAVTAVAAGQQMYTTATAGFPLLDVPEGTYDWRRLSWIGNVAAGTTGVYCVSVGDVVGTRRIAAMQLELGGYITSWIPSSVGSGGRTRAAELCAIDSALIAGDGVLELEYVPQFASTAFATSDTIWTWANGWRLDYDGSDDAIHLIVNGNSEIESAALAFAADTKFELQVRWGAWGTRLSVNGVVLTDGTAWGTPTPAAYLGSGAASAQCEAKIFGDVRIAR